MPKIINIPNVSRSYSKNNSNTGSFFETRCRYFVPQNVFLVSLSTAVSLGMNIRGGSGTSQMGANGGTIPAGGAGGAQYAAELRIYWCILQLN